MTIQWSEEQMPDYEAVKVVNSFLLVQQAIDGFDSTKTQTCQNVNGVIQWVTGTVSSGGSTPAPTPAPAPADTTNYNADPSTLRTVSGEHPTYVNGLTQVGNVITSQGRDTRAVWPAIAAGASGRIRGRITGLTDPISFGSLNMGFATTTIPPDPVRRDGSDEEARLFLDIEAMCNKEGHLFNTLVNAGDNWFEYLANVKVENGDLIDIDVTADNYNYTLTKAGGLETPGNFETYENTNYRDAALPCYPHLGGYDEGFSLADFDIFRS